MAFEREAARQSPFGNAPEKFETGRRQRERDRWDLTPSDELHGDAEAAGAIRQYRNLLTALPWDGDQLIEQRTAHRLRIAAGGGEDELVLVLREHASENAVQATNDHGDCLARDRLFGRDLDGSKNLFFRR